MVIPSVSQSIKPSISTDDPGLSVPVHKTVGDIECFRLARSKLNQQHTMQTIEANQKINARLMTLDYLLQ